jgi:hypothetical protein
MKKILTLIIALCCAINLMAFDEEDYRAYAASMREQVWKKTALPEFDNHRCPPSMKKESAVILASYDEVTIDQRKRLRGNAINLTLYNVRQLTYNHIKRRMVAINDKQALERFSQFDYQAFKKDHTYGIGDDVSCMALGVRVIKPDGTVREVSTDEFVQNAEGKKGQVKREKLTVPGLQVGDVIDYFMASMLQVREENIPPLSISYINNYPTLSFRVHIVADKDLTTQYRTLNGAPDFKSSTDEDGNVVLDAKIDNITKTEPDLWYNAIRQTPTTILCITSKKIKTEHVPTSVKDKGLQANPDAKIIAKDDWDYWETVTTLHNGFYAKQDLGKQCRKLTSLTTDEQKADFLYLGSMQNHMAVSDFDDDYNNESFFIVELARMFKQNKIPFSRIITTSVNDEPLDQLISYKHTHWLLKVGDRIYAYNKGPMGPGYLPYYLQGQKAMIQLDGKDFDQEAQELTLPEYTTADNTDSTTVNVRWDGTLAKVSREKHCRGTAKENVGFYLPTTQQLTNVYADKMAYAMYRYGDKWGKKDKQSLPEIIQKQKEAQKESFNHEVEEYIGEAAQSVDSFAIGDLGVTDARAPFCYSVSYTQNGLMKKAGPNLILSVGKLIGDQLKVEGRERERTVDCWRPTAVSFHWDITVNLPEGYKVSKESLATLNTSLDNAVAGFMAKATTQDGKLRLVVDKVYKTRITPTANWAQLLKVLDMAYDFTQKQIVVKK